MKHNIKVLIVLGAISNGGIEKLIYNLFSNIDRAVITTDLVYHNCVEPGGIKNIPSLSLWEKPIQCPNFTSFNWYAYRKWWKNFIKTHPHYDIVHCHYIDSAFCFIDLFNKKGTVTIGHAHNPKERPYTIGQFWSSIISFPSRYLFSYFFACSKQTAKEIFGSKISNSNKIFILHNGININDFKYNINVRNQLRYKLNPSNKIIIGNVGRLEKQKNQSFAIDVFNEFHKLIPNSEFWIIGTGSLCNELKQKATKLNLSHHIKFLGNRSDVNELYQAMDLFLFPSNYEGLGIVLIEAQTSGLPCICSNKIPAEADIHANILISLSLNDKVEKWVDALNTSLKIERRDSSQYAIESDYDILFNATWLYKFYIEHCEAPE